MSRSATLYALQQIDSEIDTHQRRLLELSSLIGEAEELKETRKSLEATKQALTDSRTLQKDQELELQGVNQKKRLSEKALYGGRIRNPKELTDLQEEVASLDRRKASLEDRLLETMMQVEEGEAEEKAIRSDIQRIENRWQTEQADYLAEKESLENRLDELTSLRENQVSTIPPGDLKTYEQVRGRRGGLAVVLLKDSECQGCMTGVSVARVKEAHRDTLAICGTCLRILYPG